MTVPSFDFGIATPTTKNWERFRTPSWNIMITDKSKTATGNRWLVPRKDTLSHKTKSLRSEREYGKRTTSATQHPSPQLPLPVQYREELQRRTENEKGIIEKFEKSSQLLADRKNKEQAWNAEKHRQGLWDGWYQTRLLQLVNRLSEIAA